MTGLRRMLGISASVLCFCLCAPGLAAPLANLADRKSVV